MRAIRVRIGRNMKVLPRRITLYLLGVVVVAGCGGGSSGGSPSNNPPVAVDDSATVLMNVTSFIDVLR